MNICRGLPKKAVLFFYLLTLWESPLAQADAWDDVLKQAGLTKEQIQFNDLDVQQTGGTELQLAFYKALHDEPLRIPFVARVYRQSIFENIDKPYDLTVSALQKLGLAVRRTLVGDPLLTLDIKSKAPDAVTQALKRIHKLGNALLTPIQMTELQRKAAILPKDLAQAVAYLLEAEASAYEWRQKALARLDVKFIEAAFSERTLPPKKETDEMSGVTPLTRRLISEVDLKFLMVGGIDLVYAMQKVRSMIKDLAIAEKVEFQWSTPLGLVMISAGRKNSTYMGNVPYLLIIDAFGNDTYFGGGGSFDSTRPVSILIDLKGNDQYLAGLEAERKQPRVIPRFGAGNFGYGLLVDFDGNDTYRAYRHTLGHGDFGIGLLWDLAGSDKYDCWVQCEGAAEFGAGLFVDTNGKDTYKAMHQAQGFGGPLGAGVLIDGGSEGDTYLAINTPLDFPSSIDKNQNVSLAQGAASGVRSDFIDGFSLSGGFGALVDGGGDNAFNVGFYGQGVSYWYGVGLLSGGPGNDKYDAAKYAQGASAHFGVGILHDSGGNDTYSVAQELGIGHGHDYGVGFLVEDAGDDHYQAPNFSLGCASAQGMGFFWDRNGHDSYSSREKENLGCASLRMEMPSFRPLAKTLGLFLDTAGRNKFATPLMTGQKTSAHWQNKPLHVPETFPNGLRANLIGIGHITDSPETPDPKP
jgi:hypothetical protein